MGISFHFGLHGHLRGQAARLYWEAFGGKLGRVLGPDAKALAYLERVIRADLCITALDEGGDLVGLAGFKTPTGSFAGGSWADLTAIYGPLGGRLRGMVLRRLGDEIDNDRFLVDGLCVAEARRGQGIGGRLLAILAQEGVARGYRAVRLDVVQDNWRARALYERNGFAPARTERLGPVIRFLFGFAASTTMVRPLEASTE